MLSQTVGLIGQDRSETKQLVLVLVLQVLCCVVNCHARRHNDLGGHCSFSSTYSLFIVSLLCAWNITTVEICSGVHSSLT